MIRTISAFFDNLVERLGNIGPDSTDSPDIQVQRGLLIGLIARIIVACAVLGLIYLGSNETIAAAISFAYVLVASIGMFAFGRRGKYTLFRFIQLSLIL